MKKIAIFGGAFNPIHLGHIKLAQRFDIRLRFSKIILIPTNVSPHKDNSALISGEHRLAMCRLVAEHCEHFDVSDIELRRGGKSYTVDTVKELKEAYPEDKFYLIVGGDMFLSFNTWHAAQELAQLVTVCAAAREPGEYEALIKKQRIMDTKNVKSVVCEIDALPISSTVIRERLRRGLPVEEFLPGYVLEYIRQHGLYRAG